MTRAIGRLNALQVSRESKPGKYSDGGGLYLVVSVNGTKSWMYRFTSVSGKVREMGLGPLSAFGLAEARKRATDCRQQTWSGIDPIDARKAKRAEAKRQAKKTITFKDAAKTYIEAHKAGWKNEKHADQWTSTLARYAYPVFGDEPVKSVDVDMVLGVLEPIWVTKTETARRLRGRIESVLDWAIAREYRKDANPARWHRLEELLPKKTKVHKVKHMAALPYEQIGSFMKALRQRSGLSARALELVILTAARTGEVLGSKWTEFNLDEGVWNIPGERMKAGREHRVPLSEPTLMLLRELAEIKLSPYVFPGAKKGKPLSNMAMLSLLKHMKRRDITVHGFRSTFRDWAAEKTNYPSEVVEMALAHTVANKVEAAYRRGDLLEKRKLLMEAWAQYCSEEQTPPQVLNFPSNTTKAA